jgi:hypothetical protein
METQAKKKKKNIKQAACAGNRFPASSEPFFPYIVSCVVQATYLQDFRLWRVFSE